MLTCRSAKGEASLKRSLSEEPVVEPEAKRAKLDVEPDSAESRPSDAATAPPEVSSADGTPAPGPTKPAGKGARPAKEAKDISFSEMPYTFLDADNAVLQGCMCVSGCPRPPSQTH